MSGTRGSSGLGSHRRLHIDSKTVGACVCVHVYEKEKIQQLKRAFDEKEPFYKAYT